MGIEETEGPRRKPGGSRGTSGDKELRGVSSHRNGYKKNKCKLEGGSRE
jgi:hypothetical protein